MSSFVLKKNIPAMELVLVNPLPKNIVHATVGGKENTATDTKRPINGKAGKSVNRRSETVASTFSKADKTASSSEKKIVSVARDNNGFLLPEEQQGRSVVFRRDGRKDGKDMDTGNSVFVGRPVITANTRDVAYALYYRALRKKVENFGLINFPQRNGVRLYGELTVRIPVYRDGSLFEKEGGPGIERSSGNPALDKAALNIIRRAAPFGPFPKSTRSKNAETDVWIIITRLKFTRDQGAQSQIQSTVH